MPFAERHYISYIESVRSFWKEAKGSGKFITPRDGHWNAKGHQFAAELIFKQLEKWGWLASGGQGTK